MQKGYITIAITLVLLAATVGTVSVLFFLSSGSAKTSEAEKKGVQAFFASESCLEEGLLRLKADPLYAGGSVDFPDGVCHISVNEDSGLYTFQVYFSGGEDYWRGIEAGARIANGVISLENWNEKHIVVE
jgi:hypothetical protein